MTQLQRSPILSSRSLDDVLILLKRIMPRDLDQVDDRITINYARVSSHDQKQDLVRQSQILEAFRLYCSRSRKNKKLIDGMTPAVKAVQ